MEYKCTDLNVHQTFDCCCQLFLIELLRQSLYKAMIKGIIIGISKGINCAPLLVDLFLCFYAAEFIQRNLSKTTKLQKINPSNLTFMYIDDILSINDPHFTNWIPLIYPKEIEIKETTETASSVLCLEIYFIFNTNCQLYDKRDDFKFAIIHFPHLK